jgi:hypothetical protein
MLLSPQHVAEVAHHALRGLRHVMGEPMGLEWQRLPLHEQEAFIERIAEMQTAGKAQYAPADRIIAAIANAMPPEMAGQICANPWHGRAA